MSPSLPSDRITLVDTLRGLALLGIVAIHSMAHFSCGNYPPPDHSWLRQADIFSYDVTCFLFDYKAFLLFSFLFGLSFFIQLDRAEKRGCDFRGRFAWRLVLLGVFGLIDTAFFDGDILAIFALAGFILIPLYKVRVRYLLMVSVFLLAFPLGVYNVIAAMVKPDWAVSFPFSMSPRNDETFLSMVHWNFTDGLMRRVALQILAGRVWETVGLFILGVCAGKIGLFQQVKKYQGLFLRILAGGIITTIVFYLTDRHTPEWLPSPLASPFTELTSIYWCLAYTVSFVALVTLCFKGTLATVLNAAFAPVGKMSLSCYMAQSVFFPFLYAQWGLGMASHMGFFYSTMAGIAFFIVQAVCCTVWLRFFRYGPLEWLWRSGTMLKWQPFKK